jgi:hypothetical protein
MNSVFHLSEQWAKVLSHLTFSNFFNGFKSASNFAFLGHIFNCGNKNFGGSYEKFLKTLKPNAYGTALKLEKRLSLELVLEFNFASIKGSGLFTLSKSL